MTEPNPSNLLRDAIAAAKSSAPTALMVPPRQTTPLSNLVSAEASRAITQAVSSARRSARAIFAQRDARATALTVAAIIRSGAHELRTLSAPPLEGHSHDAALHRLWRSGLILVAVFGGTIGLWLLTATLSSAVIGSGQFVVETSEKRVQHPTGGVVKQLLVREGDFVTQGDVLIRLDETLANANLQVIAKQLDEYAARRGRLEAESAGASRFDGPPDLLSRLSDPAVSQLIEAERTFFSMRHQTREGQKSQLRKRVQQLGDEITGLRSQLAAKDREADIISKELEGVRDLYRKNLIQITRLNALEREAANLDGQRGQLTSSVAQAEGKISEIELQILQLEKDFRTETQKELGDVRAKVAELSERRIAAEDQARRVEIRAPASGLIHQLAVHTIGGVISPGDPVMTIVPSSDRLVIEARVQPQDRDQLQGGQKAVVRVQASHQRTTPELEGEVDHISADAIRDPQTQSAFFKVRIKVAAEELAKLGAVPLSAGMQAQVFIKVGSRTPLEYLLKPLTDQVARAFKEN